MSSVIYFGNNSVFFYLLYEQLYRRHFTQNFFKLNDNYNGRLKKNMNGFFFF